MTDTYSGMLSEDEFLEHFGKKGMKWGVRKEPKDRASEIKKELLKIEKSRKSFRRQLIPAQAILDGAGATAGTAKRVLKLKSTKALDGSTRLVETDKTPKNLSASDKEKLSRKIDRQTYAKYVSVGGLAVGGLLAGAYLSKSKISDPKLSANAAKGALLLAGMQVLQTATIVVGVHRNASDRKLSLRTRALKQELRDITKTTKEK